MRRLAQRRSHAVNGRSMSGSSSVGCGYGDFFGSSGRSLITVGRNGEWPLDATRRCHSEARTSPPNPSGDVTLIANGTAE
jgi:hypothetical protein